jgi:hypothetical protein
MKLIQTLLFSCTLLFAALPSFSQIDGYKCPWDEVDCPGKCGRYYDADGDGFCDYGRVSKVIKPDTQKVIKPDSHVVHTTESNNRQIGSNDSASLQSTDSTAIDSIQTDETSIENKPNSSHNQRGYNLIWITLGILFLYSISSLLHKFKVFRKFVHRRIWNILLLITFLTSATLGLVLVVQINYNLGTELILSYLYWHVQFGIGMAIISFIHILWHWKYFFNLFTSKSKHDSIN